MVRFKKSLCEILKSQSSLWNRFADTLWPLLWHLGVIFTTLLLWIIIAWLVGHRLLRIAQNQLNNKTECILHSALSRKSQIVTHGRLCFVIKRQLKRLNGILDIYSRKWSDGLSRIPKVCTFRRLKQISQVIDDIAQRARKAGSCMRPLASRKDFGR